MRDIRDATVDQSIAEHILKLHMGGTMEIEQVYEIDLNDLKKYIAYSKTHCSPRLSEES